MQTFTGFQYLLIDVANQYGHDKLVFEDRIKWALEHLDALESLADDAEVKPLYLKAVQAIRKAQAGIPTGHLVGFDACCSGIQIMSALTGCTSGATATGLVDQDVRSDAYSLVTREMQKVLGSAFGVSRKDAKAALMTSFYGSKAKPVEIFGEDTPELAAFYKAAFLVAPGAWELLQELLESWKPFALFHAWKLPDGFDARVKVMTQRDIRIEVDELDHSTFSYRYYENEGQAKGLSNAANVIHSIDAYLLRCVHRRCNYQQDMVVQANAALLSELGLRRDGYTTQCDHPQDGSKLAYYLAQYERSGIADVVILPYILDGHQTQYLSTEHIEGLLSIIETMFQYEPFEVVAIHDEFKCHPNNMNHLRQQYNHVLADIAESNLLGDVLGQLYNQEITYTKLSPDLGEVIRKANYALS